MDFLKSIAIAASGLRAQAGRMRVLSENIANANTAHGVDGKPYQRQVVVFETALRQAMNSEGTASTPALRIARIEKDLRPPVQIYDPGNPDADAKGMISMPNINMPEEMADLISASRTFEANLAVVKNARAMALQTLAIGKH